MSTNQSIRGLFAFAACGLLLAVPSLAQAQNTVNMTGSIFVGNPDAGASRATVLYAETVMTNGTGSIRDITLPPNKWQISGSAMRVFSAFPGVAQNTVNFSTTHNAVTFMAGAGAGASGSIAFCPRISPCSGFSSATIPGGQGFIGIIPGPNTYGGTFLYLRHMKAGTGFWEVANPGPDPTKTLIYNRNTAGIEPTSMGGTTGNSNAPWSAGITNFRVISDDNPPGDIYTGFLAPNGSIQTLGAFQGVEATDPPNGQATGFRMTTGTVIGSDATPPTTMGGPFTFSTAGYDNRDAAGNGYIQLIGGSVIYAGGTGNVFNRITRLRMAVPEPFVPVGLALGAFGLTMVHRRRKNRASL